MSFTSVSVSLEMIKHYSADGAIFINHFLMWINGRARHGKNFHEGRTWYYITLQELHSIFYCYSKRQIERILANLVKQDVLIKGNFNKTGYDRTAWYAFKNEDKFNIVKNVSVPRHFTTNTSHFTDRGNKNHDVVTPIPKLISLNKEKERDKEKERKASANASSPPPLSSKIGFGEVVKLFQHEYDKLVSDYGQKKITDYIERMNDWLLMIGKPKKYKDFNRALRNWIREDEKKGGNATESNEEFAKKIAENFSLERGPRLRIGIEAKEDRLEIYSTHPTSSKSPSVLHYSEKAFKEQLENLLRKWGLK